MSASGERLRERLERVPGELKDLDRWVTWRKQRRNGRITKPPLQSIADARTLFSFRHACERALEQRASGLGFVLGEGVVGIDLDECLDVDGTLHDIARDALALNSYAERSPSGRGLHVLIRGTIERCRKIGKRAGVPGRELYDGRGGSSRYFTITGDRIGDATQLAEGPEAQARLDAYIAKWFSEESELDGSSGAGRASGLDDDAILRIMFEAKDGAKWRALFGGDHSSYESQSEADFALVRKLRFYAHGDATQIDRLFRRSNLVRPKWDRRRGSCADTYGSLTIAIALAKGGPYYVARDRSDQALNRAAHERTAWAKVPLSWIRPLKGAGELALRVLCTIASYADNTGEAWPSIETIAGHCDVEPRTVKAALKKLRERGVLTSTLRARQSNLYRLPRRVSDSITLDAPKRSARRVPEVGHVGCSRHEPVTDQEQTTIDTGGEE